MGLTKYGNRKRAIFIADDMNAIVGNEVIRKHSEDIKNNNGVRLINFCIIENLIITNTFYQHNILNEKFALTIY